MKKTADPRQEITDKLKPLCQFNTCQARFTLTIFFCKKINNLL